MEVRHTEQRGLTNSARWGACKLTASGHVVCRTLVEVRDDAVGGPVQKLTSRVTPASLSGKEGVVVVCGDMHGAVKEVTDTFPVEVAAERVSTGDIKQFVFDCATQQGATAVVHKCAKLRKRDHTAATSPVNTAETAVRESSAYSFTGVDILPAVHTDRLLFTRLINTRTGEPHTLRPVMVEVGKDSAVILVDSHTQKDLTLSDLGHRPQCDSAPQRSRHQCDMTQPPPQLDESPKRSGTPYEVWVCLIDIDDNGIQYPGLSQYSLAYTLVIKARPRSGHALVYDDARILQFHGHVEDEARCEARRSRKFGLHYKGRWTAHADKQDQQERSIMQKLVYTPHIPLQ